MKKVLMVYGSTTGNTEFTAEVIAKSLARNSVEVTLKNATEVSTQDLGDDYDVILLGSSTWGDDEIELQEDMAIFYEDLGRNGASCHGLKFGVFGCGDSGYTHFCGAVDALEEKVVSLGGKTVVDSLKIDGNPDAMRDEIQGWADSVYAAITY